MLFVNGILCEEKKAPAKSRAKRKGPAPDATFLTNDAVHPSDDGEDEVDVPDPVQTTPSNAEKRRDVDRFFLPRASKDVKKRVCKICVKKK